ncbi:MAG: ABC transporter ATP-binding protein [Candidatus Roseilinea sp.]|uniref:ABC transporter ATP-binding protein n=1 Tax=Candidatus Roseilinea sp. TaxID=2838777 RepID=UPI004049661B
METVLETFDLAIGYGKAIGIGSHSAGKQTTVLANQLNLRLQASEVVCLLGPNGAGKSTLMRTLAGIQPPLAGRVEIGGRDIHKMSPAQIARLLAIVLTERIDAGNLAACELVALGRHAYTGWRGTLHKRDHVIVDRALRAVQADLLRWRPVNELSDGERQKVMIARALAQEPVVLLLDEPTAFLDLPRRVEIIAMLRDLARSTGCGILLSTHDLDLALRSADRIWLLGNGGAIRTGMPEELVLNGAFNVTFDSAGGEFDASQGSFRLKRARCGSAVVRGRGAYAYWTMRALERIGFEVSAADSHLFNGHKQLEVDVAPHNGSYRWTVHKDGDTQVYTSLGELVEAARQNEELSPATERLYAKDNDETLQLGYL